jgi:hypothetical protein
MTLFSRILARGMRIANCETCFRWFSFAGGIVVIEPMVDVYTSGIWSTWHKTLELQRPNDLYLMSQKIWENTLKPTDTLMNRDTTAQEFCTNFTGPSLRWEVVGLIMTLVSLLTQSLKGGRTLFSYLIMNIG